MPDFSFDPLVLRLAEEFKRRDMKGHLDLLRAFYRDYKRRKRSMSGMKRPPWDEEMIVAWLQAFQVPPFEYALPVLGRHAPCPGCRVDTTNRNKTTIRHIFPGGIVHQCWACEVRWLELADERPV